MEFDSLKVLQASGNEQPIIALMITSDSLANPICLVGAYSELTLSDQNGVSHTFTPCSMNVAFPEKNTSGFSDLAFTVGDTQGLAMAYITQVMSNNDSAQLVLLEYLPSETTPCYSLRLTVNHCDVTPTSASITAGWHDTLNRKFPYKRYTARHFKGLRYAS